MTMNRFIAEKVMHVCWHEWEQMDGYFRGYPSCVKCKVTARVSNPDYSTRDKADLMDKCVGEEWWMPFVYWAQDRAEKIELAEIYAYLWRNLPQLVAEYHGYKKGGDAR